MSEESAAESQPGTSGQEIAPEQTSTAGAGADELFYDPSMIQGKPELEALAKELQGAFTRKTQALAKERSKYSQYEQDLALVEQFRQNPKAIIQQMAQQYGVQLGGESQQGQFEPKSWDDVIGAARQQAVDQVLEQLQPYLKDVQNVKKQSIEAQLDSKYPDWRNYEDEMTSLIKSHPTLIQDVDKLYNWAIPHDVLERRAYQAALKKIQGQTESATMTGQTTTARKSAAPTKATSFDDAVNKAREELRAKGIR